MIIPTIFIQHNNPNNNRQEEIHIQILQKTDIWLRILKWVINQTTVDNRPDNTINIRNLINSSSFSNNSNYNNKNIIKMNRNQELSWKKRVILKPKIYLNPPNFQ